MADHLDPELTIAPMVEADLEDVLAIEIECHPRPGTAAMFREELVREWARLDVVKNREGRAVAFSNYWLVHDEVHLLNIATQRASRRQGLGRSLLVHIMMVARQEGCRYVTLEVRKSNLAAQGLYLEQGFSAVGLRPRY